MKVFDIQYCESLPVIHKRVKHVYILAEEFNSIADVYNIAEEMKLRFLFAIEVIPEEKYEMLKVKSDLTLKEFVESHNETCIICEKLMLNSEYFETLPYVYSILYEENRKPQYDDKCEFNVFKRRVIGIGSETCTTCEFNSGRNIIKKTVICSKINERKKQEQFEFLKL